MNDLEKIKKEIQSIYRDAAEAYNYKDFRYIEGALTTIGEILETIVDELIELKGEKNK